MVYYYRYYLQAKDFLFRLQTADERLAGTIDVLRRDYQTVGTIISRLNPCLFIL